MLQAADLHMTFFTFYLHFRILHYYLIFIFMPKNLSRCTAQTLLKWIRNLRFFSNKQFAKICGKSSIKRWQWISVRVNTTQPTSTNTNRELSAFCLHNISSPQNLSCWAFSRHEHFEAPPLSSVKMNMIARRVPWAACCCDLFTHLMNTYVHLCTSVSTHHRMKIKNY